MITGHNFWKENKWVKKVGNTSESKIKNQIVWKKYLEIQLQLNHSMKMLKAKMKWKKNIQNPSMKSIFIISTLSHLKLSMNSMKFVIQLCYQGSIIFQQEEFHYK